MCQSSRERRFAGRFPVGAMALLAVVAGIASAAAPLPRQTGVVTPESQAVAVATDQLMYPESARRARAVSRIFQPDEPRIPSAQPVPLPAPGEVVSPWERAGRSTTPNYGDTTVRPIGSLTINIVPPTGQVPKETDQRGLLEREFGPTEYRREPLNTSYCWESPAFFNQPLYFEQPNLERYGYTWGPAQPFISAAQFWVKIPLLPYMMTVHCPDEPIYSLGYYRPGSRVPYQINWPEVRLDAITVETAFITGLCFLIP